MKKILILLILFMLFTSCLTPKSDPIPEPEVIEEIIPEPEPQPEPIVPEPEPIVEEEPTEPEVYVATEEEYDKTFSEVEEFIQKLNKLISSGNFNSWQEYLSESYIESHGNKEYLAKLSNNPVLKDYGIKLKKLRDYFNYVVVPARSNVVIDEIQFEDENRLKALTFINGKNLIVYILVKSAHGWIISD